MRLSNFYILMILSFGLIIYSCNEEEYSIPIPKSGLQNDCIKHSLGPNVIGTEMVFAYAMALLPEEGNITSAQVEASIPGGNGTYLSNESLHTDGTGNNVGIVIGNPSTQSGNITSVTFTTDTCAATLRFYYVVPEEARGKTVTFTFSANASNGQTVEYEMGPYDIRNMDMKLDMEAIDSTFYFISIADMAVYGAEEASANPQKIDLVYLYRNIPGVTFNHALMAPSADPQYLRDIIIPSGLSNMTKLIKAWNVQDQQLARLQYGVYVDDLDFKNLDFTNAPDYALNTRSESGIWVETQDGKYRAYIFINAINNVDKKITFSIKRLQMN